MNANLKGAIAENYVAWQLSKNGHNAIRLGGAGSVDVLTDSGLRIEVKSSSGTVGSKAGLKHFSFSFQMGQANGVKIKSDYCVCVGFDPDYEIPLFELCIPTNLIEVISESNNRTCYNIGVRYNNGEIEGTGKYVIEEFINNWEIIK